MNAAEANTWSGPGGRTGARERFSWNSLLWALVAPQRAQRTLVTLPGLMLIGLSFGIGTAAYNSSSNILFITLSLLLACLILSGVLAWLNLRGVTWRLRLAPPLRAGHDTLVALELRNAKTFLPTYGLSFDFVARAASATVKHRAESTISARGADVRAMLAKADEAEARMRAGLPGRLDPRGEARVEWVFKPGKRGVLRVELASVRSLFPFGFLRKDAGTTAVAETVVWPAPVEYRRLAVSSARRAAGGERVARAGTGGDLLALRRYAAGDSHRTIHWKASARTRRLLVRQFAAESAEGYALWLRTDADVWTQPEQFETAVSLAATLAEDFFRGGNLTTVAIDAEPPMPVRRVHDLELFLNRLAVVQPAGAGAMRTAASGAAPEGAPAIPEMAKQNVLTFVPEGARGVAAYVNGQKAAAA